MGLTQINTTSAVGCFPLGASPYGLLDMSGNVWEWTRSLMGKLDIKNFKFDDSFSYPYNGKDRRENLWLEPDILRVLRGNSFHLNRGDARCAARDWYYPDDGGRYYGFRVVIPPTS